MTRDVAPYLQQPYKARNQVAFNAAIKYIKYKVNMLTREGGALPFI